MDREERVRGADRWARFRFGVVAPLYGSPPAPGELQKELELLTERTWVHPIQGRPYAPAARTIETWYYKTRDEDDPVAALRRKRRSDSGQQLSVTDGVAAAIREQYSGRKYTTSMAKLRESSVGAGIRGVLGKANSYPSIYPGRTQPWTRGGWSCSCWRSVAGAWAVWSTSSHRGVLPCHV